MKKVISLLKQSDIYCLPSDSEGFPTGVVEAVICKCITVIAPYGGAKELVKNENYGIVMQNNSKIEIEKCLEKAINLSDEERKRIVDNVYERFLKGFTWKKTCDNLEKLAWEKLK